MLRKTLLLAKKDIILLLRNSGTMQAIFLGLLVIFTFSLSQKVGFPPQAQTSATLLCLSTVFCQILICNALYALEHNTHLRITLCLAPISVHTIVLAKFASALLLLLLTQCVLVPAMIIFLTQHIMAPYTFIITMMFFDIGLISIGLLIGIVTYGNAAKDSLMTLFILPLLFPLLLATIRLLEYALNAESTDIFSWFSLLLTADALFFSALFIAFPYLYIHNT